MNADLSHTADTVFTGSIPEFYDRAMVPLIFEPYALDLARRVAALKPARVLEIAAGTGVVTRALATALPDSSTIVATDLNAAMLEWAQAVGTQRPVQWRTADAMRLPFDDGAFDAVVCQFGVMFFPDKAGAYAEARRVLAPGGTLLFNVWDRIEANDFAAIVTRALAALYPADPPAFMARTPHGYHDRALIEADLQRAGYARAPTFETVAARSRAASAAQAALAYCQGTVLRTEIEARAPGGLAHATEVCTQAIAAAFGHGAVDGAIRAHVVTVGV